MLAKMYIQIFCLFFLLHYIEGKVEDLSCKDIRAFVNGHNSRRLLVAEGKVPGQPAASEMRYMIWDEELAAKAKKWAAESNGRHNPDKTVGSGRFITGENIFQTWSSDMNEQLNVDEALNSWFNEYKKYKFGPYTKWEAPKPFVGHYTQMVWSNSIYIGCAISKTINIGVDFLVLCNYGPAGNVRGQKPYKDGDASNKLVCSIDCSHPYGDKC